MPRTATTALGDILSSINGYNMIYEPFNASQGILSVEKNYLIPGANTDNSNFDDIFDSIINLNAKFKLGIKKDDSVIKKTIKTLFGNESSLSLLKSKFFPNQKKLIVKDPFLVFASLHLSKNYKIVMCERPILPLAGSFKRMGWEFPEYDRLVKDFESMGIRNIEKIENNSISLPVLGAIQFCQLYSIFKHRIDGKENIYFFNQDNFSINPEDSIKKLFNWLDEKCTDKILKKVQRLNSGDTLIPKKDVQHDLSYKKSLSNKYYKSILTDEEISFIDSVAEERFELPTRGL